MLDYEEKKEGRSIIVTPYYSEDGTQIAVLYSPGFGAGWSTWNTPELAYDRRVVEFYLWHCNDKVWMRECEISGLMSQPESAAHKEATEFFKSIGYENCPYMGGFSDIRLIWVDRGRRWKIDEYDGSEYIVFADAQPWNSF